MIMIVITRQRKCHSFYFICIFTNLTFAYKINLLPSHSVNWLPYDVVRRILTPKMTTASKYGGYQWRTEGGLGCSNPLPPEIPKF